MHLQTYCAQKNEAADLLVFNKSPITHINLFRTE
jgi:hypothetical protein